VAAQARPRKTRRTAARRQRTRRAMAGGRQDLPVEAYGGGAGNAVSVRLDDELDTKETREKRRFK